MTMIQVLNCPICEGAPSIMDRVRTINPDADDRIDLRACTDCGHWWHTPIPDQATLYSLYQAASPFVVGQGARESYEHGRETDPPFHRFVLTMASLSGARGRYLEIGTGGGHLLRRFRKQGYECYGVEPGQWVPDGAVYPNLDALPPRLSFGIVVLQDVLEHVADPPALLRRLRSMVAGDAEMFACFPCCESRPALRYRSAWNMVMPYGHLHYFSHESARQLFSRAGWRIRQARLSRHQSLTEHLARWRWRALAYELLKGGRDQLHVCASV